MYALSNLVNGQVPSARAIRTPGDASPGEVVVEEIPAGWVWDSSAGTLRQRDSAETLAISKERKKGALEEFFKDETKLSEIAAAALDPNAQAALRTRIAKLNAKKGQVDNANSQAGIDQVVW